MNVCQLRSTVRLVEFLVTFTGFPDSGVLMFEHPCADPTSSNGAGTGIIHGLIRGASCGVESACVKRSTAIFVVRDGVDWRAGSNDGVTWRLRFGIRVKVWLITSALIVSVGV